MIQASSGRIANGWSKVPASRLPHLTEEGIVLPSVAVNVSPKQFQYASMCTDILKKSRNTE